MLLLLLLSSRNVFTPIPFSALSGVGVVSLAALYCLAFWRLCRLARREILLPLGYDRMPGKSCEDKDWRLLPAGPRFWLQMPSLQRPRGKAPVGAAFVGLASAFLGVLVVLGHNLLLTGPVFCSRVQE